MSSGHFVNFDPSLSYSFPPGDGTAVLRWVVHGCEKCDLSGVGSRDIGTRRCKMRLYENGDTNTLWDPATAAQVESIEKSIK